MIDPQKVPTYLTFDDVLLLPAYSKVLPTNVDISTRLTRKIKLKCPLIAAPMDTVTETNLRRHRYHSPKSHARKTKKNGRQGKTIGERNDPGPYHHGA
jgi:hypothetical protein